MTAPKTKAPGEAPIPSQAPILLVQRWPVTTEGVDLTLVAAVVETSDIGGVD
jgi:hypothetical protein